MDRPKVWARHVEADQRRRQAQAEQQAHFLKRATVWIRWLRLATVGLALLHWAVLALVFSTTWWYPLMAIAMAWFGIFILPRLPLPILTGGLLGGGHGLVMALLHFGNEASFSAIGKVMVLVCIGLAAPVVIGMLLGYLVSQWDEDHLTQ